MKIWAIGDLHLSMDPRVEKPMDIFGGSWVNHHEKLKTIWERMVEPEDLVLIPGDISWALKLDEAKADLAWIDKLPGKKLILKGNHDLWWGSMAKMRGLYETVDFIQHDAQIASGAVIFGTRGWTCPGAKDFTPEDEPIFRREVMRLEMSIAEAKKLAEEYEAETGRKAVLIGAMHYPPMNEKYEESAFSKLFEEAGTNKVVYGHLHGVNAFKNGPQGVFRNVEYSLVSLDRLECCPRLLYTAE